MDEPVITKAMVDAQTPVNREYFDALWRGAAAQLRREVEAAMEAKINDVAATARAEVRAEIAELLAARWDAARVDYERARDSYMEGKMDAYDVAEQIARGELKG